MTDEKQNEKGRAVVRVSLDELDQEKAAFLAERFRVKRLPALVRLLITNAYDEERKLDRTYRVGSGERAGKRETRDDTIRRIRAMNIDELNDFLMDAGYFKTETETGVGDVVERERVVPHETTGNPVLEIQQWSPSTNIVSYRATTLGLDQIIAELVKNKLI